MLRFPRKPKTNIPSGSLLTLTAIPLIQKQISKHHLLMSKNIRWGGRGELLPLFPRINASPYLFFNCPFTYSSVCSRAIFIYPSRHARTPEDSDSLKVSWFKLIFKCTKMHCICLVLKNLCNKLKAQVWPDEIDRSEYSSKN